MPRRNPFHLRDEQRFGGARPEHRAEGSGSISRHAGDASSHDGMDVERAEEGLFDDPAGGLRHIRLWSGLLLIGAAIVVILVEQLLGLGTNGSSEAPAPAARPLPSLVTPFVRSDLSVKARLVERLDTVGGARAGTGREFAVIVVLVRDTQQHALVVDYADFSVLHAGRVVCIARAYPEPTQPLRARRLKDGQSVQGALICSVPRAESGLVFAYNPEDGSGVRALWSLQ